MKKRYLILPVVALAFASADLFSKDDAVATTEKTSSTQTQEEPSSADSSSAKKPDVIYVPTPQPIVDKMLEMAEIKKGDVLYDLGCGDGRIVVTAAKKYGVKAVGYDIDPERIKESLQNVKTNQVESLVSIKQKDIFKEDLSKANVVTLYLLPSLNVRLIPQLEKLPPGSRIISHSFDMKGVTPDEVVTVNGVNIYKWTTPLKKEGLSATGAEDPQRTTVEATP